MAQCLICSFVPPTLEPGDHVVSGIHHDDFVVPGVLSGLGRAARFSVFCLCISCTISRKRSSEIQQLSWVFGSNAQCRFSTFVLSNRNIPPTATAATRPSLRFYPSNPHTPAICFGSPKSQRNSPRREPTKRFRPYDATKSTTAARPR